MITVVSGLARSGTSMTMRMLQRGGLPVVEDGWRAPDPFNPWGYFEHSRAMKGDLSILEESDGKAIKILSWALPQIPDTFRGRLKVIYLHRPLSEVLASWDQMRPPEWTEREKFAEMRIAGTRWLRETQTPTLFLGYDNVRRWPTLVASRIGAFLFEDVVLDVARMAEAVDGQRLA